MGENDTVNKQFKVRIELGKPAVTFHAIEAWLEAPDIIKAGELVMLYFGALGIDTTNVVKLIEIDHHG